MCHYSGPLSSDPPPCSLKPQPTTHLSLSPVFLWPSQAKLPHCMCTMWVAGDISPVLSCQYEETSAYPPPLHHNGLLSVIRMCLVWVYPISAAATSSSACLHHISLADKKKKIAFACGLGGCWEGGRGRKIEHVCEVQRCLSYRREHAVALRLCN